SSPYLLQHAHNPVEWHPWGDEAFERAGREDRPVFLSIGYSTCHWCHVMARESFENREVAGAMNRVFVCVKVDREERPDVDRVYMKVCQMMTGAGGWPLTIVMDPDKRPFFAGTYLPRESLPGRIGMLELVDRVERLWENHRDRLLSVSEQVLEALVKPEQPGRAVADRSLLDRACRELSHGFDPEWGGFTAAPKFPSPFQLLFLLRYWKRTGTRQVLEMVLRTLTAMRRGGVFDQVGFGFHRYATDRTWMIPHFEKMLYDQALLAFVFTEAYQASGSSELGNTVHQVLAYAARELRAPQGGFYSAQDAESGGREGAFYLWRAEELDRVLDPRDSALCRAVWGVREEGNYREEATGRTTGENILALSAGVPPSASPEEAAGKLGVSESELLETLERARVALFAEREKREHPGTDDKVLADWNGYMAAAYARAGRVFRERSYLDIAESATGFIQREMADGRGLLHRFRKGNAAVPGFLADYAAVAWAHLELYQATYRTDHLRRALDLQEVQVERFWDGEGGFHDTANEAEQVLVRTRELYDGAEPSGNSLSLFNLVRLGHLAGREDYLSMAGRMARTFAEQAHRYPPGFSLFLCGVDLVLGPVREVVVAGEPGREDTERMLGLLADHFLPRTVSHLRTSENGGELESLAPFTAGQESREGRATCYLCSGFACSLPVTDPSEMQRMLLAE
ncbi:MAG: thioredoxin domain-containing protein, partial [Spirochaetota bacterium]